MTIYGLLLLLLLLILLFSVAALTRPQKKNTKYKKHSRTTRKSEVRAHDRRGVRGAADKEPRIIDFTASVYGTPYEREHRVPELEIALYPGNDATPFIKSVIYDADGKLQLGPDGDAVIRTRILGNTVDYPKARHEYVFRLSWWFPNRPIPNKIHMSFIIQCIDYTSSRANDRCTDIQAHPYRVISASDV